MSSDFPAAAVIEAAQALRASLSCSRALVVGPDTLAHWVQLEFSPEVLVKRDSVDAAAQHADPSPIDPGYDLLVVKYGLEFGTVAEARDRLLALKSLLTTNAFGLFTIRPMAHPLSVDDAPTPVGPHDLLLFPYAARMGDLGATAKNRLLLSPLSWRYMFERGGFSIVKIFRPQTDAQRIELRRAHGSRLHYFDDDALNTGAMTFLVSVDGASQNDLA
ncbi:hypothetical protein [Brevundimonas sp. Leaf168]|uniref:hypothetical protein n=1 Tax=Brevundimonas sp. Leaf168 TaxID=1736283 RepID=UPI0006FC015D|nr:hypothetical protein [Brevundimonas sp. Leaf168]KQR56241.1 hypothetical protein ASF81_07205 [Brevundimonas sp. Leaf168]